MSRAFIEPRNATPPKERQRAYRQRVSRRLDRIDAMEVALRAIIEALTGNNKPLAVKVRDIAQRGLEAGEAE